MQARRRFLVRWVWGSLALVIVVATITTLVLASLARGGFLTRWAFWSGSIVLWTGLVTVWAGLVDRFGSRIEAVLGSDLFVRFQRAKVWLFGALAAVLLGAVGNGVWKWIEQMP